VKLSVAILREFPFSHVFAGGAKAGE